MDIYDLLSQKVNDIEREMIKIGFWSEGQIEIDTKDCTSNPFTKSLGIKINESGRR